jgi:hypothetical protein
LLSSADSNSIASLIRLLVSDEVDVDEEVGPSFAELSSTLGGRVKMKVVGSDDDDKIGDFMTGLSDKDRLNAELGISDEEAVGPFVGSSLCCIVGDLLGLEVLGDRVGDEVGDRVTGLSLGVMFGISDEE